MVTGYTNGWMPFNLTMFLAASLSCLVILNSAMCHTSHTSHTSHITHHWWCRCFYGWNVLWNLVFYGKKGFCRRFCAKIYITICSLYSINTYNIQHAHYVIISLNFVICGEMALRVTIWMPGLWRAFKREHYYNSNQIKLDTSRCSFDV